MFGVSFLSPLFLIGALAAAVALFEFAASRCCVARRFCWMRGIR